MFFSVGVFFLLGGEAEGKEEGRRQSDRKQIARTEFKPPERLKYVQAVPTQSVILLAADPDARLSTPPRFPGARNARFRGTSIRLELFWYASRSGKLDL